LVVSNEAKAVLYFTLAAFVATGVIATMLLLR
jgi:hypothetical protein